MKITLTFLALIFSTLVSAAPLNKIVVFGDSLSDNGNLYAYMKQQLPLSPPYYEGRFSNGPVWVELLTTGYYSNDASTHLENYAYGGAGVTDDEDALFSLNHELDSYFLAHQDKTDEKSLYVIWIGANNYLSLPSPIDESVKTVITGIEQNLKRLADKGAKHILVVNLPDLGLAPAARELEAVAQLTAYTNQHNDALNNSVAELQKIYPDTQFIYFDVNTPFCDMWKNPQNYGFSNVAETCYDTMINPEEAQPLLKMVSMVKLADKNPGCDGFLFFDNIHPSAAAHAIMADRTKLLLLSLGIEFS